MYRKGIGPQSQLQLLQNLGKFPGLPISSSTHELILLINNILNTNLKEDWVINNNVGQSLFDTLQSLPSFSNPSVAWPNIQQSQDQYMGKSGKLGSGPLSIPGIFYFYN